MRRFETLLEAVVGMVQAGAVRFVDCLGESLVGYERDDLVGKPIPALVPEYPWEVYPGHRDEYFADPWSPYVGLDVHLSSREHVVPEVP